MEAFNKLGSLLRHSALTAGAPTSSSPALFNAARLMPTKLFVGARVITDRETGRSRGFGFVNFSNSDDAKEAVTKIDCQVHKKFYKAIQSMGPLRLHYIAGAYFSLRGRRPNCICPEDAAPEGASTLYIT